MYILELIGVAAFALVGSIAAIDKKADAFGVAVLAIITALGGGVIRDTLLGHFPPRMFTSFVYIAVALGCAVLVFFDARLRHAQFLAHHKQLDDVVNIFDAIGLAAFTVSGMDVAIAECGSDNIVLVVVMGVLTGVGGGALRDMLTITMPAVLRKHVYAVASLIGALVYYALLRLQVDAVLGAVIAMLVIVAIRILATVYKWNIPRAE